VTVFKAYDIRGVVDVELTMDLVEKIGFAITKFFQGSDIVVGMDVRTHSFRIVEALSRGLTAGGDVVFLGTSTTPMTHYASYTLGKPAVMITASHNPPEYNGLKIMRPGGLDLESHEIQQLAALLEPPPERRKGVIYVYDALTKYTDELAKRFGRIDMSIGFDPANAAGVILKPLLKATFKNVVAINDYPDGRFPAHPPDPEKAENLKQLQELVLSHKLDAGVALDGDCDRVGIVTASGKIFRPEKMVYALLNYYARPGDVVVLDVTMPLYLEKVAEERGVKIVRQRVGHSFQKPTALRVNALFWAEYSGHVGFRDHHYFDDGIYAALRLFTILTEAGVTLDKVIEEAPKVYEERLDIRTQNPRAAVEKAKERAKGFEIYELDGLDIRTRDGRLLIRPSNTEPVVRVKIEAENREGLEKLRHLLSQLIS